MRRRQPRAIRVVAAGSVVLSGAAAWLAPGTSTVALLVAAIGAAGLVVGELLAVTLPVAQGRQWRFSGSEVALAAAVLHLPGGSLWAAALVAGLVVLAMARHEGRSGRTVEFGVASFVAAAGVAGALRGQLIELGSSRLSAAVVAVLGAAIARHVLAAVAVALTSRRPVLPLVRRRLFASVVYALGNGAIGLLAAELAVSEPIGLVGLLVPAVLLSSSYEQQVRRAAQAGLYAELARAQERAGTRSVDGSAEIVLTVAARMLGGADVEMLLRGPDGIVQYLGDESGLRSRRRTDPTAFDAPWVLRLLAAGGVRLSREAGRPECGACIGRTSPPTAFLLARRGSGAPAFTRREAALVRALAAQVEPWLVSAVQVSAIPSDPGAADPEGFEELAGIREAARRVLTLADVSRFDPDELVSELHGLERSVAQLVGTVTADGASARNTNGGADGDTARHAVPVQRRTTDWTTTGRLS